MTPDLDIIANYRRTVTNTGDYLQMSIAQPVDVVLTTKITNTLTDPDIKFDVTAPDAPSQVRETLASKINTADEKTIQFGSVLVLNSFNVPNSGGLDFTNISKSLFLENKEELYKTLNLLREVSQSPKYINLSGEAISNKMIIKNNKMLDSIFQKEKIKYIRFFLIQPERDRFDALRYALKYQAFPLFPDDSFPGCGSFQKSIGDARGTVRQPFAELIVFLYNR